MTREGGLDIKIMRLRFAIGCILLAALIGVGCAKKRVMPVTPQGRRTPGAEALEREISRLMEATRQVRAYARFELVTPDGTTQSQAAVVVSRPARARIDFLDDVADVWAEAASDGKRLWLYLPLERKFYSGRANRRNLKRLTDFEWDVPDLVSVLAGSPPLRDEPFCWRWAERPKDLSSFWGATSICGPTAPEDASRVA